MNPEPLKDKQVSVHMNSVIPVAPKKEWDEYETLFYDEDVAAAVEWLKERYVMFLIPEPGITERMDKLVNEAFADVVKKEEAGRE